MSDTCKTCKANCELAGVEAVSKCKKHSPVRSLVIETENIHEFPERVVVKSTKSKRELVFTA